MAKVENVLPNARSSPNSATYVLVHGGGHGGWCWKRVAEPLRAMGHRVFTPTLTGLGERVHLLTPETNLTTHVTDIVNVLQCEELEGVILVGHSYGGMVITGVADQVPDRIRHLVFLDAAHPQNGESLAGINLESMRASVRTIDGVELAAWPTDELISGPLGVSDPEDVAWLKRQLNPQPWKSFDEPLVLKDEEAVRAIPTTDIWRKNILDMLDPDRTKRAAMADRVWAIDSPCHNLMMSDVEELTDMLAQLADI